MRDLLQVVFGALARTCHGRSVQAPGSSQMSWQLSGGELGTICETKKLAETFDRHLSGKEQV
jgi:hypothetical protein